MTAPLERMLTVPSHALRPFGFRTRATLHRLRHEFPPIVAGSPGHGGSALFSVRQAWALAHAGFSLRRYGSCGDLNELLGTLGGWPKRYDAAAEEKFLRDMTSPAMAETWDRIEFLARDSGSPDADYLLAFINHRRKFRDYLISRFAGKAANNVTTKARRRAQ